ncbi:hypothetical protein RCL_jg540.t2 [Rhizophagus clarus]|uniref:Uncharacterized protein n=1 Tax=Rhizophagus clarus TaxID=94130 RepID=A0A8H3M203_9GLOM|nr:hypothetical protein RCL_jg540.t2 [Rhizophagus clarus]
MFSLFEQSEEYYDSWLCAECLKNKRNINVSPMFRQCQQIEIDKLKSNNGLNGIAYLRYYSCILGYYHHHC